MTSIDFAAMRRAMQEEAQLGEKKNNSQDSSSTFTLTGHKYNDKPTYKVGSIPSVYYIPEFITKDEEHDLVGLIDADPSVPWSQLRHRRLKNYGGVPSHSGMIPVPVPPFLQHVFDHIGASGLFSFKPNHCLLNDYPRGTGIARHNDGPLYKPCVAVLSLLGSSVIEFHPPNTTSTNSTSNTTVTDGFSRADVYLAPRSLLVFEDDAFHHWIHTIPQRTSDTISPCISNAKQANVSVGEVYERDRRLSLTVRQVSNVKGGGEAIARALMTPSQQEDAARDLRAFLHSVNERE